MATKIRGATALTGGGTGAVDAISGAVLADGDIVVAVYDGQVYTYVVDADSGLAESSPHIIAPDVSAGDKRLILQSMSDEIDVLAIYGDGVNRTRTAIEAAKTALGAVNKYTFLIRRGTWTIDDDLTVTSNLTLKAVPGALLQIASGKTLTINGPFEAGLYQVFSGAGTVTFGSGAVKETYSEWWGALGDGSTNDGAAINKALVAFPRLSFTPGKVYAVNVVTNHIAVQSNNEIYIPVSTQIKALTSSSDSYYLFYISDKQKVKIWGGGKITGDLDSHVGAGIYEGYCIQIAGGTDIWIEGMLINSSWGDGILITKGVARSSRITLKNNRIQGNGRNNISLIDGDYINIIDNDILDAVSSAPASGIDIEPSVGTNILRWVNINGNFISGNLGVAVFVNNILDADVEQINIICNTVNNNSSHAIQAFGTTIETVKALNIEGNNIYDNQGSGIKFGNIYYGNIVGNHIKGNGIVDSVWGIELIGNVGQVAKYNNVTGNQIIGNGKEGIYVDGTDNVINGNQVSGNSQLTDNTYANIKLLGANNIVTNNRIWKGGGANKAKYGIETTAAGTASTILGNDVTNGGSTANMSLVGKTDMVMSGNIGYKSSGVALSADFAVDAIAVVDVAIPHGMNADTVFGQPALSIVVSTAVYDYVAIPIYVSVDATNVNVKVNVHVASGTGGAKAKVRANFVGYD